jgi:hypothetical protein
LNTGHYHDTFIACPNFTTVLRELDLCNNEISVLPPLGELRKLEVLRADHNMLTDVPDMRGCLTIREMHVGWNCIEVRCYLNLLFLFDTVINFKVAMQLRFLIRDYNRGMKCCVIGDGSSHTIRVWVVQLRIERTLAQGGLLTSIFMLFLFRVGGGSHGVPGQILQAIELCPQ